LQVAGGKRHVSAMGVVRPARRLRTLWGAAFILAATLAGVFLVFLPAMAAEPKPPANLPDSGQVIAFLNQTIAWYRHLAVEQQLASELSDYSFVEDNRRLGTEVVRLSFDFARADAGLLAKAKGLPADAGQEGSDSSADRALQNLADKTEKQVVQLQGEREALRSRLEAATGKRADELRSAMAETESELDLAQTRRDVLQNLIEFMGGASPSSSAASGLRTQIDELEKTVPAVLAREAEPGKTAGADSSDAASLAMASHRQEPSGIIALMADVFALSHKAQVLNESIRITGELAQASKNLRGPLGSNIRAIAQRGDALTSEPDSTDPAVLVQQKHEIDALTSQFKQQAAAVLPLAKQRILLDLYSRSLVNWHSAVKQQLASEGKSLILRLLLLALTMGIVFCGAELWRRAITRYVQDTRRRHQFLLIRRIVCWLLMAIILVAAFATELGSLATFAGLMTAGLALALQSVILAVVGYFFLIGKYGVRVGDRVQIGGISGEVVDIGLVRLHVMEFGSAAADARPTGRIVAFSNSVVFQPTGGIFKQIPGASFVWHEVTLTLAPESDQRVVEERLTEAVGSVFAEYREEMEGQRRRMEKNLKSVVVHSLEPVNRLRWTQNGLEVVVRYPLELEKAAIVDGRIARALLDALDREPKLKMVGSSLPNIRALEEGTAKGK